MAFILGLPILVLILIGAFVFFLHFMPTFIAGSRHVHNFWWIFLINFLFGWTVIGWVLALIWAINDAPRYVGTIPQYPPYNR